MFIYNKDKFSAVIQDNSVCKVTDYGLDDRGLISRRGSEVSLRHHDQASSGIQPASYSTRDHFTGIKQPKRETDQCRG